MDCLRKTKANKLTEAQHYVLQDVFNGKDRIGRQPYINVAKRLAERGLVTLRAERVGYRLTLVYSAFKIVGRYSFGTEWEVA